MSRITPIRFAASQSAQPKTVTPAINLSAPQDTYFRGSTEALGNPLALAYRLVSLRELGEQALLEGFEEDLAHTLLDGVREAMDAADEQQLSFPPGLLAKASSDEAVQIGVKLFKQAGLHNKLRDLFADAYAKHFTPQELLELNRFFSSETGRSIQETLSRRTEQGERVTLTASQSEAVNTFLKTDAGKSLVEKEAGISESLPSLLYRSGLTEEIQQLAPQILMAVLSSP